jgi:hypothetical protein
MAGRSFRLAAECCLVAQFVSRAFPAGAGSPTRRCLRRCSVLVGLDEAPTAWADHQLASARGTNNQRTGGLEGPWVVHVDVRDECHNDCSSAPGQVPSGKQRPKWSWMTARMCTCGVKTNIYRTTNSWSRARETPVRDLVIPSRASEDRQPEIVDEASPASSPTINSSPL